MNITDLTVHELKEKLDNKELTITDINKAYVDRIVEKEKDISKETLLDAIENSLLNACKNHFGKADNVKVIMDRATCDYKLIQEK